MGFMDVPRLDDTLLATAVAGTNTAAALNSTYAPVTGSPNYVHAVVDSSGGVTLYQNGVEL